MLPKVIKPDMVDRFIVEAPAIEILESPPDGDFLDIFGCLGVILFIWNLYTDIGVIAQAGSATLSVPAEPGDVVVLIANDGKTEAAIRIEA